MKLFYIFYNRERWENWLRRLEEASFEPEGSAEEMPEGLRVLYSFGMDITLAVLKVVKLYQNTRFSKEEALARIQQVEEIVLTAPPEGDLREIVESVQLSMLVLFASAKKFFEGDFRKEIKVLVKEGKKVIEEDSDKALAIAAEIGANVINGASCCGKYIKDDIDEPSLFDEWLIECETMGEALASLKNFDEEPGET
ncbi:MAG: DUF2150 family protein [Methanomicrobiales archaeon]|nr:DUF2150 family protein [Methanomicrobiales archaeon]